MGKLQTIVTLPKRILLQGWANNPYPNINGEYIFIGNSGPFNNAYINPSVILTEDGFPIPNTFDYNPIIFFNINSYGLNESGFNKWLLVFDDRDWVNNSTDINKLPLTNWQSGGAFLGTAGTITILENISGKNNKISTSRSSGFFRKYLSKEIDSSIEGLTANNSTKNIFSTMQPNGNCCLGDSSTDPVNPVFTRSTTCWAKNIDTSPISPWNNSGGYEDFTAGGFGGTGTLISPRHILFADHFSIKNGKKLIFVDMNNNCYIRTLSDQSLAASFTDIKIGLLDSDLPANVSFCKVADFDLVQKINVNNKVPVLYTDTSRNALVADYYYAGGFPFGKYGQIDQPSVNSKRRDFYEQVVGGDSGNPVSFVYNNKIILLFTFATSDIGSTPSAYLDQINSTMTTLGGGYTLSLFDEKDIRSVEKNLILK